MYVTPAMVADEAEWVHERSDLIVPLINDVRSTLGSSLDTDVEPVTGEQYEAAVDEVFADGDLALNVATLIALLRDLDVEDDYAGFVVDELLGRELAATIAGDQPLRLLGEATFHFADAHTHGADGDAAGGDDLLAALAAGFQTRMSGWAWMADESPYAVE